jgi:hypothetical protein
MATIRSRGEPVRPDLGCLRFIRSNGRNRWSTRRGTDQPE